MSVSVFPALPGLERGLRRTLISGHTTELRTVSGRRQSVAWQAGTRYRFNGSIWVRDHVPAPAPWAAYSEMEIVEWFHTAHKGSWDSFLMNDWRDGIQRRVHFTSDELSEPKIAGSYWRFDNIELETTDLDAGGPGVNPTPPLDSLALYD
jgi:hypothetical protein